MSVGLQFRGARTIGGAGKTGAESRGKIGKKGLCDLREIFTMLLTAGVTLCTGLLEGVWL